MSGVLWLLPAALAAAGPTPEARRAAVEDLIWAVLSSREFLFAR